MHRALGIEEKMQARGAVIVRDAMPDQHRQFFADQRFVVLSALDRSGHPWPFLRSGPQGFMTSPISTELKISSVPFASEADNLCLGVGDKVSVLGIELETKRRNRMNGLILSHDGTNMTIGVDQSFGNCPRYIHTRQLVEVVSPQNNVTSDQQLSAMDITQIERADMLFIASRSPNIGEDRRAGVDVNHRGGQAGFIKVLNHHTLVIPDYDGNKFFNTIGNLLLDPRVTLLLADFNNGNLLTIVGHAEVLMDVGEKADDFGADRVIKIAIDTVYRAEAAFPIRYSLETTSLDPPTPGTLKGTFMTEPCDLTAVEARSRIRDGSLKVSELLESCIQRIEARNPEVNAVVATCFDTARVQAAEMDMTRLSTTELPPLFGLPVLVKDLIETKDLCTTYGSLCFEGYIPKEDAGIVEKLRHAGAIILGKTNTPEFGAGANTFNKVYGATRNPYDPALTCGGSSGGSAVALACGMAPLAIGSDFGGSLRIPASFCGIVGMRPTPGRVPCTSLAVGHSPLWTEGPMARNVADAALCMNIIEGFVASDPRSAPLVEKTALDPVRLSKMHVGFSADLGLAELDDNIRVIFESRVSQLASAFAKQTRISPQLSDAPEVFRIIRVMDVFAGTYDLPELHSDKLGDNIKVNLAQADDISLAEAARATAAHTTMLKEFQKLFETYDLLICPATAVSPFPVEQPYPPELNGKPLDGYVAWYAVTWALSLVSCPIVTVPCGLDHKGMPFGIQIIAPRHKDRFAFSAAAAIEAQIARLNLNTTTDELS